MLEKFQRLFGAKDQMPSTFLSLAEIKHRQIMKPLQAVLEAPLEKEFGTTLIDKMRMIRRHYFPKSPIIVIDRYQKKYQEDQGFDNCYHRSLIVFKNFDSPEGPEGAFAIHVAAISKTIKRCAFLGSYVPYEFGYYVGVKYYSQDELKQESPNSLDNWQDIIRKAKEPETKDFDNLTNLSQAAHVSNNRRKMAINFESFESARPRLSQDDLVYFDKNHGSDFCETVKRLIKTALEKADPPLKD